MYVHSYMVQNFTGRAEILTSRAESLTCRARAPVLAKTFNGHGWAENFKYFTGQAGIQSGPREQFLNKRGQNASARLIELERLYLRAENFSKSRKCSA